MVATEKVVEYYFPEEPKEQRIMAVSNNTQSQSSSKRQQRASAGAATKTTFEDSISDSSSSDITKLRRKMKKLEINSLDDPVSIGKQLNSPKSHNATALRKRRYRQLERYNIDEELDIFSNFDKNE